jgi:hypothetical protein
MPNGDFQDCDGRHVANEPLVILLRPWIIGGRMERSFRCPQRRSNMNETRELSIDELDSVSGGDKPKSDPLPKLPEDPVITVMRVLGGAIWFL